MASLHQVTSITRKALIGCIGTIAGIVLLIFLFNIGATLKEALFPTPPAPPTVSYGVLPPFAFPQYPTFQHTTFTYTLNTVSGTLPALSDRATVYRILQSQPNLLGLSTAKALMTRNEFTTDPSPLSDSLFQWQNNSQTIVYNIVNSNFSLTSNYLSDPAVIAGTNLPNEQAAIDLTKQFLTNFSFDQSDLDFSKTQTNLYAIQNSQLVPATSLSNTQIIRVNFFQKNVDNKQIFYPNYPQSIMYTLVGGGQQPQIVEAGLTHQLIITDTTATYPIKTAKQAWNELLNGNAYIANYNGTKNSVTIQNIVLGYYVGTDPQPFLMPIIVFEGENNFYAYVTAVTDAWMSK